MTALRKITVEQGSAVPGRREAGTELAGAVWFIYWGHVQPRRRHLSRSSAPRRQVEEGRKCRRLGAPGFHPSPVLVLAERQYSGERGVVVAALSRTAGSLLAALCHGALVDVLQ